MKFLKENKIVLVLILTFVIVLIAFLVYRFVNNQQKFVYNDEEYIMSPKKYGVNEYSLVNIDDEQMANIYLNNYKNMLISNRSEAYSLLNDEYKNLKYPTIESFNQYVDSIDFSNIILDRYGVHKCNAGTCYYLYDKNNNEYIFRAFSVMEYEVYLDGETVEIR